MDESEIVPCYKCEADVSTKDRFCRECGAESPGQGMSWDWRSQPDFGELNVLLEPYGVVIEEIETGSDQHAIRVKPRPPNDKIHPRRA